MFVEEAAIDRRGRQPGSTREEGVVSGRKLRRSWFSFGSAAGECPGACGWA